MTDLTRQKKIVSTKQVTRKKPKGHLCKKTRAYEMLYQGETCPYCGAKIT